MAPAVACKGAAPAALLKSGAPVAFCAPHSPDVYAARRPYNTQVKEVNRYDDDDNDYSGRDLVIPSFLSQGMLPRARPARRADRHGPSAVSDGGRRNSDRPLHHCRGVAARSLGGQGGRRRGVPQGADARADQGARDGARRQEHPGDQGRGREADLGRRRRLRGAEVQPPHRDAR
ncbi:hypothetical protein VPH35_136779 [Triticum aestivum]